MALDGSYSGLCDSVASWLDRTDMAASIPDFIRLAEAQVSRKLRHRRMITRDTATINAQYVTVPDDFAGPISIKLTSGSERALEWIAPEKLQDYGGFWDKEPGEPLAYTVLGDSFGFSPAPSEEITVEMVYFARVPAIATTLSNWLLTDHPDIYLYGALVQAAPFLMEDSRTGTWATLFTTAIDDANANSRAQNQGSLLQVGSRFAP